METVPVKRNIFDQLSRMSINGPYAKVGIPLWANECCDVDVQSAVPGRVLYASYVKWAMAQGAPVCTDRVFLIDLGRQGVPKTMRNGQRIWLGIKIKPDWMPDGVGSDVKNTWTDATTETVGDWLSARCDTSTPSAAEWADDMYDDFTQWSGDSIGRVAFGVALKKIPEVVAHARQLREMGAKSYLRTQYTGIALLNGKRKDELAKPVQSAQAAPVVATVDAWRSLPYEQMTQDQQAIILSEDGVQTAAAVVAPAQKPPRPAWMDLAPHQMTPEQRDIWRREMAISG